MSNNYFYDFLKDTSIELTRTLRELENAIYNSPRSMLTHSRTFIEVLLERVMIYENLPNETYFTLLERINSLDEYGLLNDKVVNALHEVRKLGNKAAHDTRQFRFSESLTAWEHIYTIVKWYVEVYESYDITVPEYVDPIMKRDHIYDLEEMALRFKKIEDLLKQSIEKVQQEKDKEIQENSNSDEDETNDNLSEDYENQIDEEPGFVTIRTITYGDDSVNVPYFLRDAFLLPQRFEESERFLVRLGGSEEARLMSELPNSLEGFHKRITRYNETHSKIFFKELKEFISEEIRRKKLTKSRPGELFLFYKSDQIVVTEELGNFDISNENFTGMPSLIKQLNEDGIYKVHQLPKELLILGKYRSVGKSRVESFFYQLKDLQNTKINETVIR